MTAYAYVIRHDPSCDDASSWKLELNGRPLAHFGTLVAALDSAKSLQDIDGRGGFASTVDVLMSYGRFRVRWLDGQRDAICITDVGAVGTDDRAPPLAGAGAAGAAHQH